jgi:hypothetical protein
MQKKSFLRLIPRLSHSVTISLSLAAVSFVIYLSAKTLGSGDTVPASLLPIVLLTEGRIYFDSYEQHYKDTGNPVYFFVHTNRGLVSSYPLATGFLATPIYAIPVLLLKAARSPTIEEWISFAGIMEKVAAAAITSISIVVFFYTCRALNCGEATAFWLSAAFAFATEAWSTSSQGLWMHGPGVLFMLLSALLSLKLAEAPRLKWAVLLGLCCGIAIAVRLNNVLFVGLLLCWILYKQPRRFLLTLLSTSVVVIPLLAYNRLYLGSFTGAYRTSFGTPFSTGLEGVLFSPGRGLLIYFPLALFTILALVKVTREPATHRTIYLTFVVFIAAWIVSVSKWVMWWGGGCYGPRLLAEIQPFLLLTSIPVFTAIFEKPGSRFGMFAFFILFAWSSGTQLLWAYFPSDWNASPKSVDQATGRLWDWADNPISRSMRLIKPTLQQRGPLFMLLPPKEVGSLTGPRSMLVAANGKRATLSFGAEWYGLETGNYGLESWRWSPGSATVTVQNPHAFAVEAQLDLSISSLDRRPLSVVLGGQRLWQGTLTPQKIDVSIPTLYLEPGDNQLQFVTPDTTASWGNYPRRLAFALSGIRIELRDPRR